MALAILALVGGGWQLARHTSLTAVEQVQVSGLTAGTAASGTTASGTTASGTAGSGTTASGTAESGTAGSGTTAAGTAASGTAASGTTVAATNGAIETALIDAAHGMSTLGVSIAALREAVAQYPIVRSVSAHASVPHRLWINVVEQPPVAVLVAGGARTAVAADGVVLGPGYVSSALPEVALVQGHSPAPSAQAAAQATATQTTTQAAQATAAQTTTQAGSTGVQVGEPTAQTKTIPRIGQSVHGALLLQELTVLGAAPPALRREIIRVYMSTKGLTIALRGGLQAYFGDATRPHAKWVSLTRVLASPTSAGAAYIDVRLPERPAAGFPPGAIRPGASQAEAEASSGSNAATAAELASSLDAAVSGSASTGASASTSTGASASTSTGASATAGSASAGASAGGSAGAGGSGVSGSPTGTSESAATGSPDQAEPSAHDGESTAAGTSGAASGAQSGG